jgi:hypothetical protein
LNIAESPRRGLSWRTPTSRRRGSNQRQGSAGGVQGVKITPDESQDDYYYYDPSEKIWSIYLAEAERHDKAQTQAWKDEMDSILIFVSNQHSFVLNTSNIVSFIIGRSLFCQCYSIYN